MSISYISTDTLHYSSYNLYQGLSYIRYSYLCRTQSYLMCRYKFPRVFYHLYFQVVFAKNSSNPMGQFIIVHSINISSQQLPLLYQESFFYSFFQVLSYLFRVLSAIPRMDASRILSNYFIQLLCHTFIYHDFVCLVIAQEIHAMQVVLCLSFPPTRITQP